MRKFCRVRDEKLREVTVQYARILKRALMPGYVLCSDTARFALKSHAGWHSDSRVTYINYIFKSIYSFAVADSIFHCHYKI